MIYVDKSRKSKKNCYLVLKSLKSFAFSGCSLLEQIIIPPSVKSIESYAFSGCFSLTLKNEIAFFLF